MARVVLNCWGSYGDLFPYLGLAVELKIRGHDPVIATCGYYRDVIERQGILFHPVRPDVNPADSKLIARIMDPARGTEVLLREVLVPAIRQSYEDLTAATQQADFLVSHPVTFAAPLVAEVRRLPWLSVVLAPTSFFSLYDFPLLPPHPSVGHVARLSPVFARLFMKVARRITGPWTAPIRAFRAELGLRDAGDPLYEGQLSPHGTLALFSEVIGQSQQDWPPHSVTTGFVFHRDTAPLPDDVAEFIQNGEPPIVFPLGTSAVGAAGAFYEESISAAAALGRRAVLLVGRDPRNHPQSLATVGDVILAEYAPHATLFSHACAVVHHGGVGTTARALSAGRPMLVVPHAHDQPDNAARVKRLGVARVLDASRYSARRARQHLAALIDSAEYLRRAKAVAQQVNAERGASRACDEIERRLNHPMAV